MGPLHGIRVVEFTGIGPGPMAAMLLADLGASVLRLDRPAAAEAARQGARPHMTTGRPVLGVDLKSEAGAATALRLVDAADVLLEGFRPGVLERLGLGPDVCLERNPRLVYARMTGWGQDGPLARAAGHDMNYISLNGALHSIGRRGEAPVPPVNLLGDFGGGTMFVVTGILSALVERQTSGRGQVVDAAMVDGSALLMSMVYEDRARGAWSDERGTNYLDTGAPWYDVYTCADGRHVSVGCIEPQFYAAFLAGVGLAGDPDLPDQWDRERWPELRARFAAVLATRTRDEWAAVFEGTDACVQPVLSMPEAAAHPHVRARGSVVEKDGRLYPGPAPRFGRTPGRCTRDPDFPEPSAAETLKAWGLPDVDPA
ncbi:CaiB/BaiF CoA transferase family protein [Streptomonospora nanhaiensis]|uniref:Alpha-methylacyl-CoA racemase n=1 Tax=Streptomonospora nanhaiensis TaxID=1323731 RepID=A0A853BMD5_9ACTN|nr:CaiB/BaiF CoA-transferase family protein [Streptomonospora nanhaiensis]MBV2362006.1 CoA transferase [Streptomonospora nanhaiensis]MBX9386761.1 CoA transferase [Streptomonospora nanhaiensis]NYI96170.1 alpha-methylacyl-CoA racemase [Streptomonospora nanhaiensis]